MTQNLSELIQSIGCFQEDDRLLVLALTHRSYANENHCESNERLEFLGDSVLSIVVSSYLYHRLEAYPEGELTRLRATLVNEEFLVGVAQSFALGNYLRLGGGERKTGGNQRSSILADAVEAVIAAIYLQYGLPKATDWIIQRWKESIDRYVAVGRPQDAKSALQEWLQRSGKKPEYRLVGSEGPDHDRRFFVTVWVHDQQLGDGNGRSKKEAEQRAAEAALKNLSSSHAI